ncbi:HYR domain-containing protein, partial [Winogradskyella aurantiaca]|uniref:HYR domain-containing protein n=1 Tax=Winogradskyella aurantiaca TaxID=2219558 RepID=UPI000E1DADA1
SDVSDGNSNPEVITRTYSVTDLAGNSINVTQTITVDDTTNPSASNPAAVNVQCASDIPAVDTDVVSDEADNCSGAITVAHVSDVSDGNSNPEVITRTYSVTDLAGNSINVTQTITVDDTTNPSFTNVPTDISLGSDSGVCSAVVSWPAPTASDNCTISGVVSSHNPGDTFPVGTTTVTYTATDDATNTYSVSFDITINDTEIPVLDAAPADITVNCVGDVPAMTSLNWTDNCDAGGTVAGVDSALSGTTYNGTITRTWNITDSSGNVAATRTQVITIFDSVLPVISIIGDNPQTIEACSPYVELGASASDNCDGDLSGSIIIDASTVDTNVVGTYTVTYNVSDANGNNATEVTRTVDVVDTGLPTVVTQDITVQLDASGNATITVNDIDNGSSDSCGTINLVSVSPDAFDCDNTGANIVTLTVDDGNGNTATGTATVTVEDSIDPVINDCPSDQTIQTSSDGGNNCTAIATWTSPTASDNCAVTIARTDASGLNSGDAFPVGDTIIEYTATDASGNTSSVCSFTITVEDDEDPIAVCESDPITLALDNNGYAQLTTADVDDGSSDNCGNVTLGFSGPGAGSSNGNNIALGKPTQQKTTGFGGVSSRAVDGNNAGNWSSGTITHTNDRLNTWWEVDLEEDYDVVAMKIWERTDGCCNNRLRHFRVDLYDGNNIVGTQTINQSFTGSIDITVSGTGDRVRVTQLVNEYLSIAEFEVYTAGEPIYAFDCDDIGTQNVTLTVTDDAGNESQCVKEVTIIDNTAPSISCRPPLVLSLNADCIIPDSSFIDNSNNRPTVSDNCTANGDLIVTNNFADITFVVGNNTLTWTVEDESGNTNTCTQIIEVEDTSAPVIDLCPADIAVNVDAGTCEAVVDYTIPEFSDCSTLSNPANLTVTQTQGPAPSNITGGIATTTFPVGTTIIEYTAIDNTGYTTICSFEVTVTDNEAPTLTIPANVTISCDDDSSATVSGTGVATATDNCDADPIITSTDVVTAGTGNNSVITRTWRAEDIYGNFTELDQIITIEDTTAPVITCPADITVECDGDVSSAATGVATATDNCTDPTISFIDVITDADVNDNSYVITRTWTAEDENNNISTCDQIITVEDSTPPIVDCLPNVTLECGDPTDIAALGEPTATDNCDSNPTITHTDAVANGTGNNYTITRSFTITDADGNVTFCNQIIEVRDTTGPAIVCPSDVTLECDEDTTVAALGSAVATDICETDSNNLTVSHSDTVIPGTGNASVIERTWTATDPNGNSSTCLQTITLVDTSVPTITCPADITIGSSSDGTGDCSTTVSLGTPTVSDNCSLSTDLIVTNDAPSSFPVGTTVVTWTVEDASGNTNTCTQTVTVQDDEFPEIVVPNDIIVNSCDNNINYAVTASDNCDGSITAITQTDGTGFAPDVTNAFPIGITILSFEVTDAAGNTTTESFTVEVVDATDPQISCPADIEVDNDTGVCTADVSYDIFASDDCTGSTINWTFTGATVDSGSTVTTNPYAPTHTFNVGVTTVTYTIVDGGGNTAQCSFTVTVNDTELPSITCASDIAVDTDSGTCGIAVANVGLVNPTIADNCTTTGDLTLVNDAPAIFPLGDTIVTWTVTDTSGNSNTCQQTITVEDNEVPILNCPSSVVQINTDLDACTTSVDLNTVVSFTDNCTTTTLSFDIGGSAISTNYDFPIGTTTVNVTADDGSNQSTCNFDIEITDGQLPEAVCQDITLTLDDSGNATLTGADIDGGSTDNCDTSLDLTASQTLFTCADIGVNTITLTVEDDAGNSSSCDATVTIIDPGTNATVSISANPSFPICIDESVVFTATPTNEGLNPTYQWYQAGSPVAGATGPTFTPADLQFGDEVYVILFAGFCNYEVTSNTVTVSYNLPPDLSGGDEVCIGGNINLNPSSGGTWTSSDTSIATIDNNGVVTGVAIGTVTFTYTDGTTGCSNTTGDVSVIDIPTLTFPATLCEDDTYQLLPDTGGIWTSSNPSVASVTNSGLVTGVSEGSVTFTYTLPSGCSNTTSQITIDGTPEIIELTSSSTDTFCSAESTELNAVVADATSGTTVLANYNFNSGNSFAELDGQEPAGINCEVSSPDYPFQRVGPGRSTPPQAFTQNNVGGTGLNANTSIPSVVNPGRRRHFEFELTGSNLNNYGFLRVRYDARREAASRNYKRLRLYYIKDGGNRVYFGGNHNLRNNNWSRRNRTLPSGAANPNSSLIIGLEFQGGSSSDVLIDNFQIQGAAPDPGYLYSWTATPASTAGLPANAGTPSNGNISIFVNPTETTTYTFSVSNSRGCVSTEDITVTVLPSPELTVIANYCPTDAANQGTVELSPDTNGVDTTGWTWEWSTGETTETINVDIAGTYEVLGIAPNGCPAIGFMSVAEELVIDGTFSDVDITDPSSFSWYSDQIYVEDRPGRINPNTGIVDNTGELWRDGGLLGYSITEDANDTHRFFHGRDHTNNNDGKPRYFMAINGDACLSGSGSEAYPCPNTGIAYAWRQDNTPVQPNTTYYFSAWTMRLVNGNAPRLQFEVNGQLVGTDVQPPPRCGSGPECDNWGRFYGTWTSGPSDTFVNIAIVNKNPSPGGNDYAIDDISFATLSTFIDLESSLETETQDICTNTEIDPISYSIGAGLSYDDDGNLQGLDVTWTKDGSPIARPDGITEDFNGVIYNITGEIDEPGSYSYTIETSGGCTSNEIVSGTIIIEPKPLVDIEDDSRIICGSESSIAIEALTSFGAQTVPAGTWTAVDINGDPASGSFTVADLVNAPEIATYNIGATDSGTITLIYTIDNSGGSALCSESMDSIDIEIHPYVEPIINVGDITSPSDCDVIDIALSASGTVGQWTVTNGADPNSYYFSDSTDPNATFYGASGEDYELTWSIDNLGPCGVTESTSYMLSIPNCGVNLSFDGTDDVIDFRNNFGYTTSDFSIEIWIKPEKIYPDATIQSIVSKRNALDMSNGYDLRLVQNELSFYANNTKVVSRTGINRNRWFHVAVVYNNGTYTLYIDGINVSSGSGPAPSATSASNMVGGMYREGQRPTHYYEGYIDEIKFWNTALSQDQVREMMNQEIEIAGANVRGRELGLDVNGNLQWTHLDGYYRLNGNDGDITNGEVLDINGAIPGKLRNMSDTQPETAPIPYESQSDGIWANSNTWLNGNVNILPNSTGIDGTPIDWNIVKIHNSVSSGNKNIAVLGLNVFNGRLDIENSNPSDGQSIYVDKYLEIGDGVLDLVGESQLLQGDGSMAIRTGNGYLERDQQGSKSSFNYNFWGSPVSSDLNGTGFTVGDILFNGTDPNNILPISWNPWWGGASYSPTNMVLSSYWIYDFVDQDANNIWGYVQQRETGFFSKGLGFTLKGSGTTEDEQNYAFRGEPNNGTIGVPLTTRTTGQNRTLVGNPYPSALDANEFIKDNISGSSANPGSTESIEGTLYFWRMSTTNNSHYLAEYLGGYASYNLTGGTQAATPPSEIAGLGDAINLRPERYIPVGQGFMVGSPTGTQQTKQVEFRNNQRVFVKEEPNSSIFLRQGPKAKNDVNDQYDDITSRQEDEETDIIQRVRLNFTTPEGAIIPSLLGFTPDNAASEEFNYGYDAEFIDDYPNFMAYIIGDKNYIIQGVGAFDEMKRFPIGIYLETSGTVKIELTELENFSDEIDVFIYDAVEESYTQINQSEFELTLESGDYVGRFEVVFQDQNSLSTNEPTKDQDFNIYYASQRNKIVIMNPQGLEIQSIEVFNMLGQSVKTFNIERPQTYYELPFYNIQAAAYVLHVRSERGVQTKKFIVDGLRR